MLSGFKSTPRLGRERAMTTACIHRRDEKWTIHYPLKLDPARRFAYLDQFVYEWTDRENTSWTIVRVLRPEMLGQMLETHDPVVEEFALIMLRLAVCGGVPRELVPVLQFLFTQFFEPRAFTECLPVAKIFLELLPTVDQDTLDELLSTGMPNVSYVHGHLTNHEEVHFAAGLEMAGEVFPADEDSDEPKPLLNSLLVTTGDTTDADDWPEDEIPPCEIQVDPFFFALDQFACAWQKREDVAPLIERGFSPREISDMVRSDYDPD
jgi:hypothetical protein